MKFIKSHSFLPILSESIKLIPKNGKLMAFVALFSVFSTSSVFLLLFYTVRSISVDMLVTSQQSFVPEPNSFNTSDPNSFDIPNPDPSSFAPIPGLSPALIAGPLRHLQQDLAILLAVEITSFLAFFVVTFFSAISTILLSAFSYKAKNLSLKELFSTILRTWTRPLVTIFYVSALETGYFVLVLIFDAPLLMYRSKTTLSVAILIGIVAYVLYVHLSVCWALAIVVSVVEEGIYGMEALGKAEMLVKGNKLKGFLLNICFELFTWIIFRGFSMVIGKNGLVNHPMMFGLFVLSFSGLVKIFVFVPYTVLYFKCKEHHGEEIELHGDADYAKLQNLELANDNVIV